MSFYTAAFVTHSLPPKSQTLHLSPFSIINVIFCLSAIFCASISVSLGIYLQLTNYVVLFLIVAEIIAIDDVDNNESTTGNKSATVKDGHHQNNNDISTGNHMGKNVLRGDVNQKYEAKRERAEKLKEKQKKAAKAAEVGFGQLKQSLINLVRRPGETSGETDSRLK